MGVSLDKVEREAPHLVSLVKATGVRLEKNNFDPEKSKAAVVATIDKSGSTEPLFAPTQKYPDGEIQHVADLAFAAGLVFDDDGDVPVSFFDNAVRNKGNIDLSNCLKYVAKSGVRPGGGTSYISALNWIIDEAGFSGVDLSSTREHVEQHKSGMFGKKTTSTTLERLPQRVRATAAYPVFAIFITDGEPTDDQQQIVNLVHDMSQLPIFVQFIGVGQHNFKFLSYLDEMEGRFVDNVNFFDAKKASNQDQMLAGLLDEFSTSYYPEAKSKGLITG